MHTQKAEERVSLWRRIDSYSRTETVRVSVLCMLSEGIRVAFKWGVRKLGRIFRRYLSCSGLAGGID